MKIVKTASGKNRIKMSKREWADYGLKAGWVKCSTDEFSKECYSVAQAMQEYGGNFVKKLGACISAADPGNAQKLKDAFPEHWERYLNW